MKESQIASLADDAKTDTAPPQVALLSNGRYGAVAPVDGRIGTETMPGVFAQVGMEYGHRYGGTSFELFGRISEKNHAHSTLNPLAQYKKQFSLDEIYWATRILLEQLARDRPVVVQVDDVHWAEDAFLGLLEHVARRARSPVLLVCTSRPDLLERRPGAN